MSQPLAYKSYLRSTKWRNIAKAMKRYANFTCQRCHTKLDPELLDVHHMTYERLGRERFSDLQVLCRARCHPIADSQRVERVAERGEKRSFDLARDTFLSKKYGENYQSFADEAMDEEFDRWRAKKRYGETGDW